MKQVPVIAVLLAVLLAIASNESSAVRPVQQVNSPETIGIGGKLGDDDAPDKAGRLPCCEASASAATAATVGLKQKAPYPVQNGHLCWDRIKLFLLVLQQRARATPQNP